MTNYTKVERDPQHKHRQNGHTVGVVAIYEMDNRGRSVAGSPGSWLQ